MFLQMLCFAYNELPHCEKMMQEKDGRRFARRRGLILFNIIHLSVFILYASELPPLPYWLQTDSMMLKSNLTISVAFHSALPKIGPRKPRVQAEWVLL